MNLVYTKKTSIKTINFAFLLVFLLYTYVLGNIKFTTFIDSGGYQMKCEDVFKETYNREPLQAFCPYRVCPLGAHIDHQDGMIHGMALNYGVHIAYGIKQNGIVELQSLNFPKRVQFHVNDVPESKCND